MYFISGRDLNISTFLGLLWPLTNRFWTFFFGHEAAWLGPARLFPRNKTSPVDRRPKNCHGHGPQWLIPAPSSSSPWQPGNLLKYVVVVRRLEGLRSGSPFLRHRLTFVIPFCCRNYLAGLRRNLFSTLVCLPEFDSFAVAVPRSSILDPCAVRQNRPSSPMSSSPAQQVDFREPSLVLAIPLCRQLGIRVV